MQPPIPLGQTRSFPAPTVGARVPYFDIVGFGDGIRDDSASLRSADSLAAPGATLRLQPGTYKISQAVTIAAPFKPLNGCLVSPDNGIVVTIQGSPEAGDYKWIDTSRGGQVVFNPKAMATLRPTWWGAIADYDLSIDTGNGTDNFAAFQAMAAAMAPSTVAHGWRIQLPTGAMRLSQGFVFNGSGVSIEGSHDESTFIVFDPTADNLVCATWARAAGAEFFGGAIRRLRFHSPGTNAFQKTIVQLDDISEFTIEDVKINRVSSDTAANAYPAAPVNRQAKPSVGIRSRGREFLRLSRVTIFADRPIWIDNNPNYPGAPGAPTNIDLRIDSDTFHFSDLYLSTEAETEAGIVFYGSAVSGTLLSTGVKYGLNLQNFVLDGSNSFVGPGLTAIRYVVTAGQSWHNNRSVLISGVRAEGMATDAGICIDIEVDSSALEGLVIKNTQPGVTHGIKLRGVIDVDIDDFMYASVAAAPRNIFDFDATCDYIKGSNCRVAVGANNQITVGLLRKAYALGDATNFAIERDFLFVRDVSLSRMVIQGNDPDNGTAGYELANVNGQRFRLTAGLPGVSNNGAAFKDLTNNKTYWQCVNGVFTVPQSLAAGTQFVLAMVTPAYAANIVINASLGNVFVITPTDGNPFTIGAPAGSSQGQEITITIKNTFGALGLPTWTGYKMAAWVQPANGFSRSIRFMYNGVAWVEQTRTATDIPN